MRFIHVTTLLVCVSSFFTAYATQLTADQGTALVLYTGFPTGTIQQYTTTGVFVSTLPLQVLNDIPESITILNGQVYVGDGSGRVNIVNLSTGTGTTLFSTPNVGLVGLGNLNGDLLAVNNTSSSILEYSTSGILRKSIGLSVVPVTGWSGLTSDSSVIYLGDYNSGRVYEYSLIGTLLGSFDTHLGPGLVVGSYDFANDSIWVTNPSGVYDLTNAGTILSSFAVPNRPFGVAIVPASSSTPEPASWGLLIAGISILGFASKRLT